MHVGSSCTLSAQGQSWSSWQATQEIVLQAMKGRHIGIFPNEMVSDIHMAPPDSLDHCRLQIKSDESECIKDSGQEAC